MNNEQLVYRLTVELYDLKHKIEIIRAYTQEINDLSTESPNILGLSIDIINLIDEVNVYD